MRRHSDATVQHIVQLCDDVASSASALADFVEEGLARRHVVLVVADASKWTLASHLLADRAVEVSVSAAAGQLAFLESSSLLDRIVGLAGLDKALFDQEVAGRVRRLRERGMPLRIYGDMVDRLAMEGDFKAARELEGLWNEFLVDQPFTLMCGYTSVHFADPSAGRVLRQICHAHTSVVVDETDMLAAFLIEAAVPGGINPPA
jgi:MEDS: MEthanogen/methylotroph, DcmR Sensory domain